MSNFQRNGVARQQNACSIADADRAFDKTCRTCASHGLCGDCDSCPIAAAHAFTVDTYKLLDEIRRTPRIPVPAR